MAEKTEKKAASASSAGSSGAEKRESSKGSGSGGNPAASPAGSSASAGLLSKTPVLLGAAMIIEAVVLFAGFKFVGGGRTASAAGAELALSEGHDAGSHEPGAGSDTSPDDPAKTVEINLLDFKAPNSRSGRNFLYDVSIYVVTKGEHQKTVSQAIQAREALIKDRVRTIIAESDPDKLGGGSEPGLETLRRQIKYQLDEIIGDGLIEEVLIPRCTPYRADF